MNTRIPTYEPNNDSCTSTNLRMGIRQQAGPCESSSSGCCLRDFF